MDGSHDGQDTDGLQQADEIGAGLALDLGHVLFPPLGKDQVDVGEGGSQHPTPDPHQHTGKHCYDIDSHQVFGGELGLEQAKVVLVLEAMKRRVEQICMMQTGLFSLHPLTTSTHETTQEHLKVA